MEQIVSIARENGFDVTGEDLLSAVQALKKERRNSSIERLDPEDLDKIAGGGTS